MKKKSLIITTSILMILIVVGLVTKYIDTANVSTGHEPECCIKIVSADGDKVTYWGLGYKVVRYVGVFPDEPYENNIGAKMGSWFMKYEDPTNVILDVKNFGGNNTFQIREKADVDFVANLLKHSKYTDELCDGIIDYAITYDDYTYDILISCSGIRKGNKQAKLSDKDIKELEKIILKNKKLLTVDEMLKLLPEDSKKTITNLDNPKTEEVIFESAPPIYLYDENTDVVGKKLDKITYNTEFDALLGPITFYVDKSTGIVIGSDYRE